MSQLDCGRHDNSARQFNPAQIAEIRRLAKQLCCACGQFVSHGAIAKRFGVTKPAIWRIVNYRTYKDLP